MQPVFWCLCAQLKLWAHHLLTAYFEVVSPSFQMRKTEAQGRETFAQACTASPRTSGCQAPLAFLPHWVVVGLNPGPATSRLCDFGQFSAPL